MARSLEGIEHTLRDTDAGWVSRRDAAVTLGKLAQHAIAVLQEFRNEKDVDVCMAIEKALDGLKAPALPLSAAPAATKEPLSLERLAKTLEKEDERVVQPARKGFVVQVALDGDRKQRVHLTPFKHPEGAKLIRVYTYCGHPEDDALRWALRANTKMTQGALGLVEHEGEEMFALVRCFLADEVTPRELKIAVKEIAFYGDWIEQKLSERDVH